MTNQSYRPYSPLRLFLTRVLPAAFMFSLIFGCGTSGGQAPEGNGGSDYPSEDIEFIVPYNPGGGYDSWVRLVAPFVEKHLPNDVAVTVKNVPGADGQIAANQMYAAEPDGTQIQIFNFTGLVAGQLSGEAEYDLGEFSYIGRLTSDPQVLNVASNSEINSMEELQQAAPIKQSLAGFTSSDGVTAVVLYDALGLEYTPVLHTEGGGEQRLSVIRGDTDAVINSLESVLGDIQAGDLKPILFIGPEKPAEGEPGYEEVKDVETISDIGYPEFGEILSTQRVIAAPPGLPDDMKQVLDQALQDALNDPEFIAQAEEAEVTPKPLSADETTEVVNETIEKLSEYEDIFAEAIKQG